MMYGKRPEEIFELYCRSQIFNKLQPYLSKDKITIDIGAGIGTITCLLYKYSKLVYCFEPEPNHVKELIGYNFPGVSVYEVALSDEEEESTFFIHFGSSTLIRDEITQNWNTIKVKTRTLDSYNFTDVGFIKIDVEGNEINVLRGAKKTIELFKPFILVEIIQSQLKYNAQDIFTFLKDYEGYYLDGDNNLKRVIDVGMITDTKQKELHSYDILFIPRN